MSTSDDAGRSGRLPRPDRTRTDGDLERIESDLQAEEYLTDEKLDIALDRAIDALLRGDLDESPFGDARSMGVPDVESRS